MEHIVLILANFAAYFLLAYKCFTLFEGLLSGKRYGILIKLLIAVLNTSLMLAMALHLQINYAYAISFVVLYLELWLFFRNPLRETFSITVIVMMNVMCFRGIVISAFAMLAGKTLYDVYNSTTLFLCVLLTSNMLEWLSLYIVLRFFKIEDMRTSMNNRTQTFYIAIWASLCDIFMFKSIEVYINDYSIPHMIFEHLNYCFLILLSFYFLLVYTFNMNKTFKISKNLSQALGDQIKLQSAITRDAVYVARANLSQNRIISGLEVYGDAPDFINNDYDVWFNFAKTKISPKDFEKCFIDFERQNLLNGFKQGIEPKPIEYRRLGNDNKYHWVRSVVSLFKDVETDDVHIFGYAFDIDNEIKERQMLERSAQTDLFTGLYNKATTEKLVEDEIKKGTGIIVLLDIDDFKDVNDKYGHEAGDYVLRFLAAFLKDTFRKCDIVGRIGGDEFLAFIKDSTDISLAKYRASEIVNQLQSTAIEYLDKRIFITLSIGIAVIDKDVDSFSSAYKKADCALYRVKQNGKNAYSIYNSKTDCSVY